MTKLIELGVCKSEELSTILIAMEAFRFKLLRVFLTDGNLTFIYG